MLWNFKLFICKIQNVSYVFQNFQISMLLFSSQIEIIWNITGILDNKYVHDTMSNKYVLDKHLIFD